MTATATHTLADYDTRALAARYAADGVATIGPLLTRDELAEVRFHVDRYCRFVVPNLPQAIRDKTVRFEPDGESIRSCYFMDQVDEYFLEFGLRAKFTDLVRDVVGYEPELYVVETFNKYARIGSAATAHQDCAFLPLDPVEMAHLWIAVDDVTAENGALRYRLGTHRQGLFPHVPARFGQRVDDAYVDYPADNILTAVLPAGSPVVHSGLVVHDSPPNLTPTPLLGLLCGYRGAHTRYVRDED